MDGPLGLDLDVSWCLCLCHHFFVLCCVSSVSVVLVVLHSILKLTSRAQCQWGLCQKKSKSGEILNYWKAMSIRLIDCENLRSSGSTQISSLMWFDVPICNILFFFNCCTVSSWILHFVNVDAFCAGDRKQSMTERVLNPAPRDLDAVLHCSISPLTIMHYR